MALKGRTYIESHSVKYRCQRCHELVLCRGKLQCVAQESRDKEKQLLISEILRIFFESSILVSYILVSVTANDTLNSYIKDVLTRVYFLFERDRMTYFGLISCENNSADRSCRNQTAVWSHPVYLSPVDKDTFDPAVWKTSATAYSLSRASYQQMSGGKSRCHLKVSQSETPEQSHYLETEQHSNNISKPALFLKFYKSLGY